MSEIAVLSGKGGTGKTNLVAALVSLYDNLVVVDCDVDAANLPILLKPGDYHKEKFVAGRSAQLNSSTCTNCGTCYSLCRFDAISMEHGRAHISETACDGCGLCAYACPVNAITMQDHDESWWAAGFIKSGRLVHARLVPGEENSGKLVSEVRRYAKQIAKETGWDTIIIDGPPGLGCPVISTLTGVDKVIVVAEPTHSSFHDVKRLLALIEEFAIPVGLVINKYDLNTDVCSQIETWCLENEISLLGKIPFDEHLVEAMTRCQSVVDWMPEAPSSLAIQSIANRIFNDKKEHYVYERENSRG